MEVCCPCHLVPHPAPFGFTFLPSRPPFANRETSVIETNVAIVCACLPCLRALVGRYIPSLLHLAGRREPMDIYTIPISHVAQRPPERPVASDGQNKNSNPSTCGNSSWMSSEPLNPDRSSGIREDDTA